MSFIMLALTAAGSNALVLPHQASTTTPLAPLRLRGGARLTAESIRSAVRLIVESDATVLGMVLMSTGHISKETAHGSPLDPVQTSRVGSSLLRLRGGAHYPKLAREVAIHLWAQRVAARLVLGLTS